MDQARLHTEQQTADGAVIVKVTGEIDVSTTDLLADALAQAADVAAVVVADLAAVSFMDSPASVPCCAPTTTWTPAAAGSHSPALNRRSCESWNSPARTR